MRKEKKSRRNWMKLWKIKRRKKMIRISTRKEQGVKIKE